MIRDLIPWTQLTRTGIPDFLVSRRSLTVGEVTIRVGEPLNAELFSPAIRRARLRQFYEQRLLEPVAPPKGSRQAHRPAQIPVPSEPVVSATPLPLSLPDISIPVAVETSAEKSSYNPSRRVPRRGRGK